MLVMQVKLDDITPELVRELSDEREESRLQSLLHVELRQLSEEFEDARRRANRVLARCQLRAIKLHNLGVDVDEISHMFGQPKRVVSKWVSSDVEVPVTGLNRKGGK